MSWAKIKYKQADDADQLAACASGIGEYGIANACYRLAGLLRAQADAVQKVAEEVRRAARAFDDLHAAWLTENQAPDSVEAEKA